MLDAAIGEDAGARQEGRARDNDLAARQYLQLLAPYRVPAGRKAGEAAGITGDDQACGALDARQDAQESRRQMMAIRDDAGDEPIVRELFKKVVLMARQD